VSRLPATERTPDELRIAERYLEVCDYLSRCAQAVRDGEWGYLADKADDLSLRAQHLATAAGDLCAGPPPRARVVTTTIAAHADSEAARMLHPPTPSAPVGPDALTPVAALVALHAGNFVAARRILAGLPEHEMAHLAAAAANLIDLAGQIDAARAAESAHLEQRPGID
jgi:hypothetical protein